MLVIGIVKGTLKIVKRKKKNTVYTCNRNCERDITKQSRKNPKTLYVLVIGIGKGTSQNRQETKVRHSICF